MSNNVRELNEIICANDDKEQAVFVAIKVFSAFLEQLAEAPTPPADGQPESA